MDIFWFCYTMALIAVALVAAVWNMAVWFQSSRRANAFMAGWFALFCLDTVLILLDEYERTWSDFLETSELYVGVSLTHPILQTFVSWGLVVCLWGYVANVMYRYPAHERGKLALVAAAPLAAESLLALFYVSGGWFVKFLYWTLRDVCFFVALLALCRYLSKDAMGRQGPGARRRKVLYVAALVLCACTTAEDALNILVPSGNPLYQLFSDDVTWHFYGRNFSENALMVVLAVNSMLAGHNLMGLYARHPAGSDLVSGDKGDSEVRLDDLVLSYSERRGLSKREQDVLRYLLEDSTISYIASKLCISTGTVKAHISHIYKKTGATSREELISDFWSYR